MNDLELNSRHQAYLNARNYWATTIRTSAVDERLEHIKKTIQESIRSYHDVVVEPFHDWLKTQGVAVVNRKLSDKMYGVDSYNVAVGTDVLEFVDAQSKVIFLLRWS
jgi:hypothetical protein